MALPDSALTPHRLVCLCP